ncbi:MAG: hypothetical protein ACP5JG_03695 [Anaerolineae bacterium]
MASRRDLSVYLLRAFHRPRPWLVRYLLLTLPAVLLVPLIALPLLPWFRIPLWLEALETRSLDALVEVLAHSTVSGGPLLLFALLALPLLWLIVRALWLLTEGGVLVTYARSDAPSWREFGRACLRWFGSFLLMSLLGTLISLVLAAPTLVLTMLSRRAWPPLGIFLGVGGGALVAVVRFWMELGRASAVVRDDRHVIRALRYGGRLLTQRPLSLLGLAMSTGLLRWLVVFGARRVALEIPQPQWLLTLLFQQLVQVVTIWLPLIRKAGEVGWAVRVFGTELTSGNATPDMRGPVSDPVDV